MFTVLLYDPKGYGSSLWMGTGAVVPNRFKEIPPLEIEESISVFAAASSPSKAWNQKS